ncbi:hypothetical protein J6590_087389 [Homalodisca vitripennis]|nr:hypothetical protein J6590_087389 [Homalodisca vitripennis]
MGSNDPIFEDDSTDFYSITSPTIDESHSGKQNVDVGSQVIKKVMPPRKRRFYHADLP